MKGGREGEEGGGIHMGGIIGYALSQGPKEPQNGGKPGERPVMRKVEPGTLISIRDGSPTLNSL